MTHTGNATESPWGGQPEAEKFFESPKIERNTRVVRRTAWKWAAAVSSMATRLESLRRFYRVQPICSKDANGVVDVRFRVFPRSMIRNLNIRGNVQVYTEEFENVFLRPGMLLALDQAEGESEIRRQEQTLVNYYERDLHESPGRRQFPSTGPDLVDCTISIEEGQRRRIEEVDIRFIRDLVDSTIRDEELLPEWQCPRFSSRMLEKASGVDEIEVHTERTERTLKTNLTEFLQKHGIKDPQIQAHFDENNGRLSMDIRYEHCHRIQFFVRSDHGPGESGFRFREPDGWRDILSFGTSGTYDFSEAEYSRRLLESHLENEGFLFSETLDYRESILEEGSEGSKAPRFLASLPSWSQRAISQRSKGRIRGDEPFLSDEIREQLETQKYDFFERGLSASSSSSLNSRTCKSDTGPMDTIDIVMLDSSHKEST